MKQIETVDFNDTPEYIQEQIYRELGDEDQSYEEWIPERGEMMVDLYEYDPSHQEDKELLTEWLKGKIDEEGEPYSDTVDEIGNDGKITHPILVVSGTCREGRHRLTASLKFNYTIRAYVV